MVLRNYTQQNELVDRALKCTAFTVQSKHLRISLGCLWQYSEKSRKIDGSVWMASLGHLWKFSENLRNTVGSIRQSSKLFRIVTNVPVFTLLLVRFLTGLPRGNHGNQWNFIIIYCFYIVLLNFSIYFTLSLPGSIMETCNIVLTNEISLALPSHGTICFVEFEKKWNFYFSWIFTLATTRSGTLYKSVFLRLAHTTLNTQNKTCLRALFCYFPLQHFFFFVISPGSKKNGDEDLKKIATDIFNSGGCVAPHTLNV